MLEMIALFAINVISLFLLYKILKFGYNKIFSKKENIPNDSSYKKWTFLERVNETEDALRRGEPITEEQLFELQIYYKDTAKSGLSFIPQPSNKK